MAIDRISSAGIEDGAVVPADLSTGAPTWDASGNLTPSGQIRGTAANTPPVLADSAGNTATLRVWCNFNGTLAGPITPRASFNVSSVTKSGTGSYTVNFTNAMPDANYSFAEGNTDIQANGSVTNAAALNTTNIQVTSRNSSGTLTDCSFVFVTIFR